MTVKLERIRIGTRGSPLALTQTKMVCAELEKIHPELETEIVIIKTSGDWKPEDGEVRLSALEGGKAQFAKEIEEELLSGTIDAAVHSMKDMETFLPPGLVINHMLPREDPRDVMLVNKDICGENIHSINDLAHGITIGTSSVRRQAFLLSQRQDLDIVPLRGNVKTRIDKLRNGQIDATILANSGLKRLGLAKEADIILGPEKMLPSAGQGAVGIEIEENSKNILSIFSQLSCKQTVFCVKAERAALAALNGSCHTPIGAYAKLNNHEMHLRIRIASPNGDQDYFTEVKQKITNIKDAEKLGHKLGEKLKKLVPPEILI